MTDAAAAQPSAWNLPNALTALRIALVPVFFTLLVREDGRDADSRWWAAAVFLVAMVTDKVDGDLARRRGLVTNFGKIADPIADKALTGAAFVGLSLLGELWWWVTVVVLVREVGITAVRFVVIRHGVMPAGRGGKAKTVLQTLALTLFVAPLPGWLDWLDVLIMTVAVLVTLATGADYLAKAEALRRTSPRTAAKKARRADAPRQRP